MMRRTGCMAGWMLAVLAGCGGGDGTTAPDGPTRLEIGPAASAVTLLPAGSVQTQTLEVRNRDVGTARNVVVTVAADAKVLQAPLACNPANACVTRDDGAVVIAELKGGASVSLMQTLRIQPGHRGAISNSWNAVDAAGTATTWRQELMAYATDVAVTIDAPQTVTVDGQDASLYVVTLTNAGADDATNVAWELAASPGTTWLASRCSASGGAPCPSTLGERLIVPQLPRASSLKIELTLRPNDSRWDFLVSRAEAAGDTTPANNRASHSLYGLSRTLGHMTAIDLQGHAFRVTLGYRARFVGDGWSREFEAPVDVTGTQYLQAAGSTLDWAHPGHLSGKGGLIVGSATLDGPHTVFIGVQDPVTALSELEGQRFNILGSRTDASGKPLDAFVWAGRFNAGVFEICASGEPVALDSCPASQLQRYEAALAGEVLELVSARHGVMRWRAARGAQGPVLVSSTRDATTGESRFMIGTPAAGGGYSSSAYPIPVALADMTFDSATGVASAALASFETTSSASIMLKPSGDIPQSYFLFLNSTGEDGLCGLSAPLVSSAQAGVFTGPLQATTRKGRTCFTGAVAHVQTSQFTALLGTKGSALMGRWAFQVN